jgi:hypothetical protein
MTIPKLALMLACLIPVALGPNEVPKEGKVTPLFSKDLNQHWKIKHYSLREGTYEFKSRATHREWDRDCPSVRTVCTRSVLPILCG